MNTIKTIKKVKLKKKEESIFDSDRLFFSGYAFTDNKNFAHFGLKKLPKLNIKYKKFSFDKENLTFSLDIETQPIVNGSKVMFGNYFADIIYYNYFKKLKGELHFFKLSKFLGEETTNKVLVFKKESSNPIGVLNLQRIEKKE
jgi:hypothetical protein